MSDKNDKAQETLKEIEATIGKIMGSLSKRASQGQIVSTDDLEMVLLLSQLAKIVHKHIEAYSNE